MSASRYKLRPIFQSDAKKYIARNHRHTNPPLGCIFCVAVEEEGEVVGVAMAGRPIARKLDDGVTLEITRVCTNGATNVCSMLYGACKRAAVALGYERVITYTLEEEPGSSLRASQFRAVHKGEPGKLWSGKTRKRVQTDLFGNEMRSLQAKTRWQWP